MQDKCSKANLISKTKFHYVCPRLFFPLKCIQGVPKKIVHSNFLTPGHDFLTGSSNFGSQHQFQNLQAKGVYLKAFSKNDKCLKTTKIGASASARK